MNQPPAMISTKDLSYISDMFEWNFVAAKTIHHFETELMDQEIKTLFKKIYKMHCGICNKLVKILEECNE